MTAGKMRRILILWFCLCLLPVPCLGEGADEAVIRSPLAESGLTMLEEGNVFLQRYNEITGAELSAVFPLGMPYLWGGGYSRSMFARAPLYPTRVCYTDSEFFEAGRVYLGGFDCLGFIRWIWLDNHLGEVPSLNTLLDDVQSLQGWIRYSNHPRMELPMPGWADIASTLEIGDLFVNRKESGRHIMMYIGTPRMWGFDEGSELGAYLDHPLMIHCGLNPTYGERMQRFIDEGGEFYQYCHTTDGGVAVSILIEDPAQAPFHAHVQLTDYDYFQIGETVVTAYHTDGIQRYTWLRADRYIRP